MSGLVDLVRGVAPALATALGGPLAGAAVSFLASKLGVDPAVVQQTVAGMGPADLVKMKELDLQFQAAMAENGIKIDLAQAEVNKVEAASTDRFISGWRPFVGWVCGLGLAYAALLEPLMRFAAQVGLSYAGDFPPVDTTITLQLITGMLGLGGLRTFEKAKNAEGNR
jgi:hypothetical protein